jgi:pyruvate formate lyase activating enzyme
MRKVGELWVTYGQEMEKKVQCHVCAHHCIISPGKRGFCRTRENLDGQLFTIVYGSAIHHGSNDPVEKKPLYHFWPGSNAYSIATIGCNFHCKFCQNWEISQACPDENGKSGDFLGADKEMANEFKLTEITPEQVVKWTKAAGSVSIAYTYNEPTIWYEFIKDTAILAHKWGIKNIMVSNGYSSPESNAEFAKIIDAINIDIKAFNDDFYKRLIGVPSLKPVLDTCVFLKKAGVHVEITNLLIPNENDNREEIRKMCQWIVQNLGSNTPLHFSAYHPDYRLNQPHTPSSLLIDAYNIAKEEGLYFVYMGNVRSDKGQNTECHQCGTVLIERHGYLVKKGMLTSDMKCQKCGSPALIQGQYSQADRPFFI